MSLKKIDEQRPINSYLKTYPCKCFLGLLDPTINLSSDGRTLAFEMFSSQKNVRVHLLSLWTLCSTQKLAIYNKINPNGLMIPQSATSADWINSSVHECHARVRWHTIHTIIIHDIDKRAKLHFWFAYPFPCAFVENVTVCLVLGQLLRSHASITTCFRTE